VLGVEDRSTRILFTPEGLDRSQRMTFDELAEAALQPRLDQ
jgi:hypothetical protein